MNDLISRQTEFFDVVDQIVKLDKLSHSYLIEINDFDEDIKHIKCFVKMILCKNKDVSYNKLNCSFCNICKLIDEDNYPDLKIVESDGQWIKKSQLLELKSEYQNKSLLDNKRVYIIKDADKLNSSSANTILKFLEEPEEDIIAILLTNNRYKVIETILSRCQILSLKEENENIDIDDNLITLLRLIIDGEALFIHYKSLIDDILIDKEISKQLFIKIENIFIDYLNYMSLKQSELNGEVITILKDISEKNIIKYISIIEDELPKLSFNINYKLWLDSIFSKLVEVRKCMM